MRVCTVLWLALALSIFNEECKDIKISLLGQNGNSPGNFRKNAAALSLLVKFPTHNNQYLLFLIKKTRKPLGFQLKASCLAYSSFP